MPSNAESISSRLQRYLRSASRKPARAPGGDDALARALERQLEDTNERLRELIEELRALRETAHTISQKEPFGRALTSPSAEEQRTVSFQLGKAFIDATKSQKGLLRLPFEIYRLTGVAKTRRRKLQTVETKKAIFAPPSPAASAQLRLLTILDEISEASWSTEFRMFPVSRGNYRNQISTSTSAALFLESCWKGNRGAWEYAFTSPGLSHANAQALLEAIEIAKKRNMPVLFWNKEDPMHYEKFLPIAAKCDIVFTTDANKISAYKRDLPGARVETLAFAAAPHITNPSGRFKTHAESICFAGSYYSVGHEDRKRQMDALLPAIPPLGGAIYDRFSKLRSERYQYPPEYRPYIRDSVPFTRMAELYKRFKIFLNVNTVTTSPTMMSRRVYEILATGTPVISTPSAAIEAQFPGIVQIASTASEAREIAESLLHNEQRWLRLGHIGYREVMSHHTYAHRSRAVREALGERADKTTPLVTVVTASNRPNMIERIVTNIARQEHPRIEAIIVTQGYSSLDEDRLRTQLAQNAPHLERLILIEDNSTTPLGSRLNRAIDEATGAYVAKMDDDDFYFPKYLSDMLLPFSFGNWGLVGKREIFVHLEGQDATYVRFANERHQSTSFVAGPTFVAKTEVLRSNRFAPVNHGEDSSLLKQLELKGIGIYATDPFNFIQYRSASPAQHTWQVDDAFFINKGTHVGRGLAEDVVVV